MSATVGETLRAARARLAAAGLDTPELDARLLLGRTLGISAPGLLAGPDRQVEAAELSAFEDLLRRRIAGEPVDRILGRRAFWTLELELGSETLSPRPDTETVVLAALEAVGDRRSEALRILDLGTGTGAILLALLSEIPRGWGLGTDIAPAALAVARRNAARAGLADRTAFLCADFAAPLGGRFDLVVSNPPYIASGEIDRLAPEVRGHDPRRALDGGPDGLACYRRIAAALPNLLEPAGIAVLELGIGQSEVVAELMRAAGLEPEGARDDLSGVARALVARHASNQRTVQGEKALGKPAPKG